jgi:YD repeat-containing protein
MQPAGAITNPEPAYTWTAAPNATQHRVYIHKQGSGLVVYDQILAVSDTCTGTDCQLPPGTGPYLENGSYEWLIQGQNSGGNGDWAGPVAFSLNLNPPGTPTLIQPADAATITDQDRLTYEWNVVNDASYYNLQIRNTGTGQTLHNVWYRGTDIGCTTTCTVRPEICLVNGNYSWSVQTWGPGGIGGTATRTFAINAGLPGVATLISPSGTITSTRNPAFTFTAGDYTTWHHIVVTNNPDDGTVHYDMWHEASELGCEGGGTCTLDAGLSLFNGNYLWKVESYSPAGSTIWSADQSFKISFGG